MKKKVLSLFSGIGAFEKALKNLGIEFDLVNYCEIDKFASKSYSLIHNVSEEKNLVDVTKVNTDLLPRDIDLLTFGYPCQDISQAGKQRGFEDENGKRTRSGLFFEALRIIEDVKYKLNLTETTDIINYCLTHIFKRREHLKDLKRRKAKATSIEDLRLYITGKK